MIVFCAQCGKQISRKPSSIPESGKVYCSKVCHNESMKKGFFVSCCVCGNTFYKPPSKITENNCCCAECRNELDRQRALDQLNLPGHNAGHSAPWLTKFNRLLSIHENTIDVDSSVYRSIVEAAIGRKLRRGEVIHHINGDRTDNRLENLQIMTNSEHSRLHHRHAQRRYAAGEVM